MPGAFDIIGVFRSGITPSQPYLTFTYDGSSQRVRKENHFTGATTLYFGEVYEVRNEEPIIHLFANTQRIASIHEDGRMQYYHGNHLNSASVITDGYGNTKETIEYHPYGTYRLRTDLDASFPNVNYTFTDQEEDDEAGLYNYKARLYDPLLGRFISADSIVPEPGNLQAYNRYSYCLNNPVIYTDPSGQFFGIDDILIGMAITALIGATVGATVAAVNGTNIGMGAITGAISGSLVYAGGMVGGALAGVINASITGGDIGQSALWGAIGAGAGYLTGYAIGELDISNQYVAAGVSIAAGGLVGGGLSALAGGDFVQGFTSAITGAMAGYFANMGMQHIIKKSTQTNSNEEKVSQAMEVDKSDRSLLSNSENTMATPDGMSITQVRGTGQPMTGFRSERDHELLRDMSRILNEMQKRGVFGQENTKGKFCEQYLYPGKQFYTKPDSPNPNPCIRWERHPILSF